MTAFIKGTAFCLSLGCFKNQVDSERIVGVLREAGYEIVASPNGAEVCVVNTCGFLRSAVEENIAAILDLAEIKEQGETARIGVVGCLVNRYGDDLVRDLPEVDFWARSEDYGVLAAAVSPAAQPLAGQLLRVRMPGTPAHVRYLKLAEGCDNRCAYCAIPNIRGALHSTPIARLVAEAHSLVTEGAREICLVAQDLTAYASDLGQPDGLIALLDALESSLPQDIWLRLLYLQPRGVTRELIERVANGRQILPYLDMPIQHASASVLRAMNRDEDIERHYGLLRLAREIRPDFALRTTCMVGFPGETRADFDALLRFIEKAAYDRLGAFVFSPEEGTTAAGLAGKVARKTQQSRLNRLMELQEGISLDRQTLFVGRQLDVVVDKALTETDGIMEGRSFREAPEVDGIVEIQPAAPHAPGDIVRVSVTDACCHDLFAKEVV